MVFMVYGEDPFTGHKIIQMWLISKPYCWKPQRLHRKGRVPRVTVLTMAVGSIPIVSLARGSISRASRWPREVITPANRFSIAILNVIYAITVVNVGCPMGVNGNLHGRRNLIWTHFVFRVIYDWIAGLVSWRIGASFRTFLAEISALMKALHRFKNREATHSIFKRV